MNNSSLISANYRFANTDDVLYINYKMLIGIVALMLLHLIGVYHLWIGAAVAILEALIILRYLVIGNYAKSLYLWGMFMMTSYDTFSFFGIAAGNDKLYSLVTLPVVGVYFSFFYFIFLFVGVIIKKKSTNLRLTNPYVKFANYTIIAGLLMGLIFNLQNGLYKNAIIADIGMSLIPAIMLIVFSYFITKDRLFMKKYQNILFHMLLAYTIVAWITISLGVYCNFDSSRTKVLMLPLASVFLTSIILFYPMLKNIQDKIFLLLSYASTIIFQLAFDSCLNGKSWIIFVISIIVASYVAIKASFYNNVIKGVLTITMLGVVFLLLLPKFNVYTQNSDNVKLQDFLTLFDAGRSGDIDDLGSSSGYRVLELINSAEEHLRQPVYLPFGRGYGGYVPSNGYFFWKGYDDGTFSEEQYKFDKFYAVHGTMNITLLKFGFVGLIWVIIICISTFLKIRFNIWFYLGFTWLFYFWGYSINLLFFGLPTLIIAYRHYEIQRLKNYSNKIF